MTSNRTQSPNLAWKQGAVAIGLISLWIGGSGGPVAAQVQEGESFAQWCEKISTLTPQARHTVEALLQKAETQDCQSAEEQLTNLTFLNLIENQIVDVTPLASLTNLTGLNLGGNQIVDVTPLASLTNLTELRLIENQIEDITPLSSLTNLKALLLSENQIENVTPLSSLTNLTELYLGGNSIVDRTCPVERASVCLFEKPDDL